MRSVLWIGCLCLTAPSCPNCPCLPLSAPPQDLEAQRAERAADKTFMTMLRDGSPPLQPDVRIKEVEERFGKVGWVGGC